MQNRKRQVILPAYYDLVDDFDLVAASLQEQYGIRISKELDSMKTKELFMFIRGLGPDTSLGRIISIRAESDPEVLKEFTPDQRRIRAEWLKKQASTVSEERMEQVLETFKMAFMGIADSKGKDEQ